MNAMTGGAPIWVSEAVLLVMIFLTVVLFVLGASLAFPKRTTIEQRLRSTEPADRGGASLRYQESGFRRFVARFERYLIPQDDGKRSSIRRRLVQAGYQSPYAVSIFYALRVILGVGLGALAITMAPIVLGAMPIQKLYVIVIGAMAAGFFGPALFVSQRISERQRIIREAFPDTLDLLLVCVEAGLGLNAAIVRVSADIEKACPLMGEQLRLVGLEMQAGASRETALRNLSERVGIEELAAMVSLLVQSDSMGVSIAQTLRVYAAEMRRQRLFRAEEHANKLPVRMVLPLASFVMPAFILVITMPSVIRVARILIPAFRGQH